MPADDGSVYARVSGPGIGPCPRDGDCTAQLEVAAVPRALKPELEALRNRLQAAEHALDWAQCAVYLLDARAAILFANRPARRLLAAGDGLRRSGAALAACVNGDAAVLRAAIARAADAASRASFTSDPITLRIRRGAGSLPLIARVIAAPPARSPAAAAGPSVALFVVDPGARSSVAVRLLREAFDLTEREVSVALAMLRLGSLSAAAIELGIAQTTARSHLQHVFDKTGARNQVALTQLLLAVAALPASSDASSGC